MDSDLSVELLPGWGVNPQPEIVESDAPGGEGRTRLWFGEQAIFLMMVRERPGVGEARIGSSLVIHGGPESCGSFNQVTVAALRRRAKVRRTTGGKSPFFDACSAETSRNAGLDV